MAVLLLKLIRCYVVLLDLLSSDRVLARLLLRLVVLAQEDLRRLLPLVVQNHLAPLVLE